MDPPGPIRLLGLTVSGLDEEVPMQDSLFESPQDKTEDKLSSVLDSLESKFGETAVMSGALWATLSRRQWNTQKTVRVESGSGCTA